jgi:hypothetical protein
VKRVKVRLYSYYQIIHDEGQHISSWYIAERTCQTRNKVANDLRYAKKFGWIKFKTIMVNLQIGFEFTEKGIHRMNCIGMGLIESLERGQAA